MLSVSLVVNPINTEKMAKDVQISNFLDQDYELNYHIHGVQPSYILHKLSILVACWIR